MKFTWDALSRNIDQTGPRGVVHSDYDLADRRTQLTYPGSGLYVNYDYLTTGEITKIRQNGATSGKGVLATYAYDDLGNRTSLTLGNGVVTTYSYDLVSRLASQTIDFPVGSTNDLTIGGMAYNPASQLTSVNRSNDTYAWTASGSGSTTYVPNGLNQYASIAGAAPTYDSNGNMKTEPQSGKNYLYTSENLLDAVSGGGVPAATLTYDPLMRLYEDQSNTSGLGTQFVYDGTDMIAEYDQSNVLQKRTVFGAGQPAPAEAGEPLVQLDAAGNRTWLTADERGSIIALSDDSGNVSAKNAYDEYGKPQPGNTGRFQYTGQAWIADLGTSPASGQGLYYYKSRMYAPHLGRFMQPDPIGYAGDGLNLYAYVLNDPVNYVDPLGMGAVPPSTPGGPPIIVTGIRPTGPSLGVMLAFMAPGNAVLTTPAWTKEALVHQKLPRCELKWLANKLSGLGFQTSNLPQVVFNRGFSIPGGRGTVVAYAQTRTRAVTFRNNIFVKGVEWNTFTALGNPYRIEEIIHTTQYATDGRWFLPAYLFSSASQYVRGNDWYLDNRFEAQAQSLSRSLSKQFDKEKPCG